MIPAVVIPAVVSALLAGCAGQTAPPSAGAEAYNEVDVMFTQMMIPHHGDAIAMADFLLDHEGVRPEVAALAEDIATGQRAENEQMNDWLATVDEGTVDLAEPSVGTESLEEATPAQIEGAFLTEMIAHHEHGVEMSRSAAARGDSAVIGDLAQKMTQDQTEEITTMKSLLAAG